MLLLITLLFGVINAQITINNDPCDTLYINRNCSLVCSTAELAAASVLIIPSSGGVDSVGQIPTNISKIASYMLNGWSGFYYGSGNTLPSIYVDCGTSIGVTLELAIRYDAEGDYIWERTEIFDKFSCDPVTGYELYTFADGNPQTFVQQTGLYPNQAVNGNIQVMMWQSSGPATATIQVKTDSSSNGQLTRLVLPFVLATQSVTVNSASQLCDRYCPIAFPPDVCGVCSGPGPTGCDFKCGSTLTVDACGICGGVGPTGCDNQCNSTKVVDTCGLCDGPGGCTAPPNTVKAGNCLELYCSSYTPKWMHPYPYIEIPKSQFTRNTETVPANPANKLVFKISNLYGYYNVDEKWTRFNFTVDALNAAGHAVEASVIYDFDGDGIEDRKELFREIVLNDVVGWQVYSRIGDPGPTGPTSSIADPCVECNFGNFQNMVNGSITLEIWSAYETGCCGVYLDLSNSWLQIPYVTTWWTGQEACNTTSCNCVAFRFDEMEDYYNIGVQTKIVDTFRNLSVPLTVSILGQVFGNDISLRTQMQLFVANSNFDLEIAEYAFSPNYASLSFPQLTNIIVQDINRIYNTLNRVPITFVPGGFNSLSQNVSRSLGFSRFSHNIDGDPRPWSLYPQENIYRFPSTLTTRDPRNIPITQVQDQMQDPDTMILKIKASLSRNGFAVVEMRQNEFSVGIPNITGTVYINTPNTQAFNYLTTTIDRLRNLGVRIVTVKNIGLNDTGLVTPSFTSGRVTSGGVTTGSVTTNVPFTTAEVTSSPLTTGEMTSGQYTTGVFINNNCNCVAFRLDNVQDWYTKKGVIAIMDAFKELGVPITLGVIANSVGADNELVDRIKSGASDSNTNTRVELAVNGYQFERFSDFSLSNQTRLFNQAINKIRSSFGVTPKTFIPPYHTWNSNTLAAMRNASLQVFSSRRIIDLPPYIVDANTRPLRFPSDAYTTDIYTYNRAKPIDYTQTWEQVFKQLRSFGFAVVEIYGGEFLNWDGNTYTETLNITHLYEVKYLVQALKQFGLDFVRIQDIYANWRARPLLVGSGIPQLTTGQATTGDSEVSASLSQTVPTILIVSVVIFIFVLFF